MVIYTCEISVGVSYITINYHQSAAMLSSNSDFTGDGGFKEAQFDQFRGNDYNTINLENLEVINYKYSSELESGEIILTLVSGNKKIWSSGELGGQSKDSGEIVLKDAKNIKLRVIGKNATGKYKFEWGVK